MCALAGQSNVGLFDREPALARAYVESAVRHWPAMLSLGPRFGPTIEIAGQGPLKSWLTLYYAFGVLGLSKNDMRVSPRRTPAELLKIVDSQGPPP